MANNTETEEDECGGDHDQYKKKKIVRLGDHNHNHNHPGQGQGPGPGQGCCQAERCGADLSEEKRYHRRHKVCEFHSKSPVVPVAGLNQRFCQQCSRFHELSEFDEAKRSCRRRLAGHNERRRKSSVECYGSGEGSAAAAAASVTGKIMTSKETHHHYNSNNNNINSMTLHQGNTSTAAHYKHYVK